MVWFRTEVNTQLRIHAFGFRLSRTVKFVAGFSYPAARKRGFTGSHAYPKP